MANATETSDSSGYSPLPTPSSSSHGLSAGAIAGIVLGTVFAISVLICLVFILLRRRRVRQSRPTHETVAAQNNRTTFQNDPATIYRHPPPFWTHPATVHGQSTTNYSHSATGKDIPDLSPKQVLGLDDASYLGRLPTQYGQTSNLAVHPAYVPPQFDRLPGAQSRYPPPNPERVATSGVNPWDLEYGPNSVIFPHLVETSSTTQPLPAELQAESAKSPESDHGRMRSPVESPKSPGRFEALSNTLKRIKQSRSGRKVASPQVELEMTDFSSSEDSAHSSSSTAADDSSRTLSPATTNSTLSGVDKGKEPAKDHGLVPTEAVDFATYAVAIPEQSDEDITMDIDPVSAAAAMALVPQAASPIGPPPDAEFRCSKCSEVFRLPGLLRNHDNRKHNLRYTCHVCNAAFGLRADLERHKVTKHNKELGLKPAKVFKCPNADCSTPEKEYHRKDNFMRHTRRCQKAGVRVKMKKQDDKEAR